MKIKILTICLILIFSFSAVSHAALPTFDAINAALNEIRNALMQSQFAQDIALAVERLEQLKATYFEMLRFNSGLDDFFETVMGDPFRDFLTAGRARIRDLFWDRGWFRPRIERMNEAALPEDIRQALEDLTGEIPDSEARPYIPFEEFQVVEGFEIAKKIREEGEKTRSGAKSISLQAKTASPKGAARLGVQAMSQMILLAQENQEALAKLIELSATQVEQVSRDEKRFERERLKHMQEFQDAVQNLGRPE